MISNQVKRRVEEIEAQTVAREDEQKLVIKIVGVNPNGTETGVWRVIEVPMPRNDRGGGKE
jgi:hypothetical protein